MELQPLSTRSKLIIGGTVAAGASLVLALYLASRQRSSGSTTSGAARSSPFNAIRNALGYGPSVDERHAAAVFEVVSDNIETIIKRITTLHTRAIGAGVAVQSTLVNISSASDSASEQNPALVGDRANGYYYFSSDGKRLKTKWDSFDVDSACAELDNEPITSAPSSAKKEKPIESVATENSTPAGVIKPASIDPITLRALRTEAGGVEKACETCMEDLDTVNGTAVTPAQKAERKDLVARLHTILQQVDEVLKPVNELLQ
jgi:hypothetical protein